MTTDKDVLDYLAALMKRSGLSGAALGAELNTGRATVNNWFNRLGRVPEEWYAPLAKVFGVTEDDFRTAGKGVTVIRHAGHRVRLMRKGQDLTAAEVAARSGLALEEYERLERDGVLPETKPFLELARVLQVKNPHWLAHGDPAVVPPSPPAGGDSERTQKPQGGGKR
jgi:DNA-binding XRE family transcriptional regulator